MTSRRQARNLALGAGLTGTPAPFSELASVNSPAARPVAGAVGAVSRTLGQFRNELKAAQALVASGVQVVEIDPAEIDDSPVKDRLEVDAEQQAVLVESIRRSGQQSPVLLRRTSISPARYQLAYGHRRVAACRHLGRKVLALVRSLSDEELLVAQGQENSSRADLSYIERAAFAHNLEKRGVVRETIMLALATDKTELSKMISVARAVPSEIIAAVGPAPKAGRTRWLGMAERLSSGGVDASVSELVDSAAFRNAPTDLRFDTLFKHLAARPKDRPRSAWANPEGKVLVRCVRSPRLVTLAVDEKEEPGFAQFVFENLDKLYSGFLARKRNPL